VLKNHKLRQDLSAELHARPFPKISAPTSVAYIAITTQGTPAKDRAVLRKLLALLGHGDIAPQGSHFFQDLGPVTLKWERYTEFVSYMLFQSTTDMALFEQDTHKLFPEKWYASTKGEIITSCRLDVVGPMAQKDVEKYAVQELFGMFRRESLAMSYVLGCEAVVACDFVINDDNHIRFAVLAIGQVGENRLGRIVQRLFEIETYKSLSMLTLPVARNIFAQLGALNSDLSEAVRAIAQGDGTSQDRLEALLSVSAKIEYLQSESAYRFSSVDAYSAIVAQRIEVLREERIVGRQTFAEFMMRRFDPAMRTCHAAQKRLRGISARAERASDLLATRVTVRTNEDNRAVLKQMDRRASLQLRLQETVEGLSVVAISYYGINLASYFLAPFAKYYGVDKVKLSAALVIPVMGLVWFLMRRIKRRANKTE